MAKNRRTSPAPAQFPSQPASSPPLKSLLLLFNQKILMKDLTIKSPGGGLSPYQINKIIGKKAKKTIYIDDNILLKDVK